MCNVDWPIVITLSWQQEPKSLSTEQPVFSLAMSELIICHTAIGKEPRVCSIIIVLCCKHIVLQEHLSSLVTLMGGTSHADLTRVTTHLVAGQVGTTKYHVSPCIISLVHGQLL